MSEREPIVERVGALGLPDERYVVIGSGVMDALGLRESRDIDLVVTPDYFDELRSSGKWTAAIRHDEEALEKDDAEVWQSWGSDGVPNFATLYAGGVTIDGVRFAHPKVVLDWKRYHPSEKNDRDVVILERYLEANG